MIVSIVLRTLTLLPQPNQRLQPQLYSFPLRFQAGQPQRIFHQRVINYDIRAHVYKLPKSIRNIPQPKSASTGLPFPSFVT